MWNIAEQIQKAALALEVTVTPLSSSRAETLRERVTSHYASRSDHRPLWERLSSAVSVQNADAWQWMGDYMGDGPAILFFNPEDEPVMFELSHGNDIVSILADCTGFEVYLTNAEAQFILCFNHHDFLIAAGDAAAWLISSLNKQAGH